MARLCEECAGPLPPSIRQIKYCSDACRKAGSRRRNRPVVAVLDVPEGESTVASVRRELEAAGRLQSFRGQAAIRLAQRIDQSTAVMGFATLVAQLEKTMDAALAGSEPAELDFLDEVRARRDRKLTG